MSSVSAMNSYRQIIVTAKLPLALVFLVACCFHGKFATAQTLEEVLRKTLSTNPDVLAADKRIAVEEYNYDEIRGRYLPSIDLNAAAGREWSDNPSVRLRGRDGLTLTRTEVSLTLTQLLFDGFDTRNALLGQKSQIQASTYQLNDVKQVVSLRTIEVYLDVLRRQELVRLAKDNLSKLEEILDKIRLRSESGAGRKVDQTQIEGRYALAKTSVLVAEQNLIDARSNYLRVVGELPYDLVKPVFSLSLPSTQEEALTKARDSHPAILAARENVAVSRAGKKRAQAAYLPRIDVEAGASHNNDIEGVDATNEDASILLRMRYNLFRGGADRARILSNEQRISEALEQLASIQRAVEEEVMLAWNALDNVRSRLQYLKAHQDRTLEVRSGYEKQFSIGKRTLLDLLDVENEYFRARSDYTTGLYTELFGNYRVTASMGVISDLL